MAAADSLLTPLESCKNGVHSSWHQVVRQRQVSSGQQGSKSAHYQPPRGVCHFWVGRASAPQKVRLHPMGGLLFPQLTDLVVSIVKQRSG